MAPHMFLPLACSANLAKNLAAVAASSTRAPIYRTFALQNNLVGGPDTAGSLVLYFLGLSGCKLRSLM